MNIEKLTRCAGVLAGWPLVTQPRAPGIHQPGTYGRTAGAGAHPGVGARQNQRGVEHGAKR